MGSKQGILARFINRSRETIVQEKSIEVEKLKHLIVSATSVELEIVVHEHPRVDILFKTYEGGPELKTEQTEDSLIIKAKKEGKMTIVMFGNMPKCHLVINVPKEIAEHWDVSTTSGKITTAQILAQTIRLRAVSGSIALSESSAGRLTIHATSGKLKIRDVKVEQLNFDVTSGNVDIASVYGDIEGEVLSGKINIANVKGQNLELKTGSGKIYLQDSYMENVEVSSSSGRIDLQRLHADAVRTIVSSGNIKLTDVHGALKGRASSGNITLNLEDNTTVDLSTGSGNIYVEFKEYELNTAFDIQTSSGNIVTNIPMQIEDRQKGSLRGKAGEGDHLIRLRTTSGKVVMDTTKSAIVN